MTEDTTLPEVKLGVDVYDEQRGTVCVITSDGDTVWSGNDHDDWIPEDELKAELAYATGYADGYRRAREIIEGEQND